MAIIKNISMRPTKAYTQKYQGESLAPGSEAALLKKCCGLQLITGMFRKTPEKNKDLSVDDKIK
jgi:hypothetical protein